MSRGDLEPPCVQPATHRARFGHQLAGYAASMLSDITHLQAGVLVVEVGVIAVAALVGLLRGL